MAVNGGVMRRVSILALVVSMFMTLLPAAPAHAAEEWRVRNRLYELVNQKRASLGLRRLQVNDKTAYWAKDHARWMANHNSMTHDSATELWREIPAGSQYRSENISWLLPATDDGIAKLVHRAFLASPGHRANILASRNTHMGLGVVKKGGTYWVVQRFVDRNW